MKRISKETETKLVRSLEKVASLVQDGDTPDDAIVKVATDDNLPIGHVQLMVQAFNNARFNQQRKSSSLIEDKTAHFKLANPADIYERLWPTNVKEAQAKSLQKTNEISDEYTRPPVAVKADKFSMPAFTKAASLFSVRPPVLQHDADYFVKKAYSLLREAETEHAERRRLMMSSRDKVAEAFDDLTEYFKGQYHLPFPEVKEASVALYGPQAEPIFKHLMDLLPRLNKDRAGHYKVAIDRTQPPYSLIEKCLNKVSEYTSRSEDLGRFSKEAGAATAGLIEQVMPMQRVPLKGSLLSHRHTEKRADEDGLGGAIGTIGQGMMGHALGSQLMKATEPREKDKLERKSLLGLMDPAHEQRLRGVRAQATFHDMMANDEYLKGADPTHLTKLYNEIARVSPRAVDQPLVMRALLRRYVGQGYADSHDVAQLAELEGTLKNREVAPEPQPLLASQE